MEKSTTLEQAELLRSQTNARDGQIKVNSSDSEPLFTQEEIPGSPFTLVLWKGENKWDIRWGKWRINEKPGEGGYHAAMKWINENILNIMVTISTIVVQWNIENGIKNINEEILKMKDGAK